MLWRLGWAMLCGVVLVLPAQVRAQEAQPAAARNGRQVVSVQEVPPGGQGLQVGESEVVWVASTEEVLAWVETGAEGSAVAITPRSGRGYRYTMRVQFVHDPEIGGRLVTAEEMKRQVQSVAAEYGDVSAEPQLRYRSLKYGGRPGWYATLTDRRLVEVAQPSVDDYKHVAVGVVRISEGTVMEFELFTNDLASRDFFGPLEFALGFVKPLPAPPAQPEHPATQPAK